MIDFHCHLDLYPAPGYVVNRVNRESMHVLAVTTTPRAWEGTRRLVENASRVRLALGLHPQLVAARHNEVQLLSSLLPETQYVGEVGLDASPPFRQYSALQEEVFVGILDACARAGGRILSVHSRRATTAVLDALELRPGAGTAVLHWFAGTPPELERAVELGCWFSVGPAMLATKRGALLTERMPRNRVLTETDGPFTSLGGKVLMPWDACRAVEVLAAVWNLDTTAAQHQVMDNHSRLTSWSG